MTEKQKLEALLAAVKYKMQVLEAIEERLQKMLTIAHTANDFMVVEEERILLQKEMDQLYEEIHILERPPTLPS